jgi:predicted amidohydrolase
MASDTDRSVSIATVQMDVQPAQRDDRLYRADQIIQDAVQLGAELVVLPELFNTGYAYVDENFQRAEPLEGPTVTWMKRTARRMGIHLAGSLLLREEGDIYNAMFIIAPDGSTWRYDKSYPWGWERGYFRPNRGKGAGRAVVAKTALGDLGMLICWDLAHTDLWQPFAGQIDLMVICSCPPMATGFTFYLPPDIELSGARRGPLLASLDEEEGQRIFGAMLDEQASWLGVPAVNSAGCGNFESPVPYGPATLLGLASGAPGLLRYLPRAGEMSVRAGMIDACRIISGQGKTLAHREPSQGEGFVMSEVSLPAEKPQTTGPQPRSTLSGRTYFFSDTVLPRIMGSIYQRGIHRIRASGR